MKYLDRLLCLSSGLIIAACSVASHPLTIRTEPAGAQLSQNGRLLGQSPLTIDYPKHDLREGRMTLKVDVQWPSGVIKKQALIDVPPQHETTQITIKRPNLPGRTVDEDYGKAYLALRRQKQSRAEQNPALVVMTTQSRELVVNCNKVGESSSAKGLNCTYSCLGEVVTETIPSPMTCPTFIQRAP